MLSFWTRLKTYRLVKGKPIILLAVYAKQSGLLTTLIEKPFQNIVVKGENAEPAFSPFTTGFSTLSALQIIILTNFILSSAMLSIWVRQEIFLSVKTSKRQKYY